LLLKAKKHAIHFTVNAYPLTAVLQKPDEHELMVFQKEEANRHMSELFVISKQIWELNEQFKPLKPLTDLMLQYTALFCELYSSLTLEMSGEKKIYQTGENTKLLLDQFNDEIRGLERCLREFDN